MAGFIKLHRKMKKWGWYKDPNTFRLFVHLLLSASYKEVDYRGHHIMPGQVVCGRKQLAEELGLGEQTIRTALNHLKSTNEVTIKSTNKFSIVTIVNWAKYQCLVQDANQQNDQQDDQQLTSKTAKSNHIQEVIQEVIEEREGAHAPTFEEICEYVRQKNYKFDPAAFFDYYEAIGWTRKNGQPIRDWKAAVRTWNRRERDFGNGRNGSTPPEPPKYPEFKPEPKIDAVEMPESMRKSLKKLKEA